MSGRTHRHTPFKSGSCLKRDTAHSALVEMCLNFDDEDSGLVPFDDEGFVKLRKSSAFEGYIHYRPADREDCTL